MTMAKPSTGFNVVFPDNFEENRKRKYRRLIKSLKGDNSASAEKQLLSLLSKKGLTPVVVGNLANPNPY